MEEKNEIEGYGESGKLIYTGPEEMAIMGLKDNQLVSLAPDKEIVEESMHPEKSSSSLNDSNTPRFEEENK